MPFNQMRWLLSNPPRAVPASSTRPYQYFNSLNQYTMKTPFITGITF